MRRGGLLGIPTETVYGLGADALNETAVRHIFEAKGRPQDNPLIIHVPDASWLERYCREVPETAYRLAERFWPGPLTMILPRRENVPLQTTGGLETVGVRCPDHPVTRAIIEAAGVPVAAPSGNTSGRPSPTTAGHMAEDMDGKIDGIVDGGPCAVGVESTIIDLTVTPPRLLRPGGLPLEALEEVLGTVAVDKAVTGLLKDGEKPRAPGMKYRHYAPKAPVTAVTGDPAHSALVIRGLLREKAGVICFDEFAGYFEGHIVHRLGPFTDKLAQPAGVRRSAHLRRNGRDGDFRHVPMMRLGLAVGNRLKKAAGFHLIDGDAPVVIGITGGTGSGKTSALQALEALGGTVLDCDAVYHQALREDETLRRRIRDAFGEVFRGTELDRQKLGSLVFSDPQALERLNGIIFDYLPGVLRRRMEGRVLVGLDAINLIESGLGELCCRTVAVLAPGEQRVQRIMQRDHIPEKYARLRIQAQKPDSYYREHCTDVLENQEETPEAFREKAEIFFRDLLRQLHHITEGGHEQ
ncbi:MAG: L-threonylcarbamoyladenylate synthase [Oscillospiraceae bacterium]